MTTTHKFRMYPNKEAREKLDFALDICRQVYNTLLGELNNQKIYKYHMITYGMLNKQQISYIAGFFDGEGSIYMLHNKKTNQIFLCVNLTNTNKKVLDWINKNLGGKLSLSKDKRAKIQLYRLRWYSQNALSILKVLKPYLQIKKNKCKLAIEFQEKQVKGIKTINFDEQLKIKEAIKNA